MITYNGVLYTNLDDLKAAIAPLSDEQKKFIINDFNGLPNIAVNSVTNQQLRTALVMVSFQQNKPHLHPDAIKTFLENLSEPNRSLALQQWEYSNEMLRSNPLLNSLAPSLGLTSEDLDDFWVFASTL